MNETEREDQARARRAGGSPTRRRLTGLAGAILLVGLVGLAVLGVLRALERGPFSTLVSEGVLRPGDALLLTDVQSSMGDASLERALTEVLRAGLERSTLIRLVPAEAVRDGLVRLRERLETPLPPPLAREFAFRSGIPGLLLGEVHDTPSGFLVTLRLLRPDAPDALVTLGENAADTSELVSAVDRLTTRMRARIGESRRLLAREAPLDATHAAPLPALQAWAEGVWTMERGFASSVAVERLREAVAEDPGFAIAWAGLASALEARGDPPSAPREAIARAFELRDRLPEHERLRIEARYHDLVEGDPTLARERHAAILARHPDDAAALEALARIAMREDGDRAGALALRRRALAADSTIVSRFRRVMALQLALGEIEAARQTQAEVAARFGGIPGVERTAAEFAWATGAYGDAEFRFRSILDDPRATEEDLRAALRALAKIEAVRGRLEAAEDWMGALVELHAAVGVPRLPEDAPAFPARLRFFLAADTAGALVRAEAARARLRGGAGDPAGVDPTGAAPLQLAEIYLRSGRREDARRLADAWDRAVEEAGPPAFRARAARSDLEALFDLEEGRPDAAIRHHRAGADSGRREAEHLHALGEVLERTGDPAAALEAFQGVQDLPGERRRESDPFLLASRLAALAGIHEREGRPERARRALQQLAELWVAADPELAARADAAGRRAAALAAGGEDGP